MAVKKNGQAVLAVMVWSGGGRDQAVEQLVLGGFELAHLGGQRVAVSAHGVGVTLGLMVILLGEGRLRDEGPQAGFVGVVGEVGELFLGHRKLDANGLQALRCVSQTPFDQGPTHVGEPSQRLRRPRSTSRRGAGPAKMGLVPGPPQPAPPGAGSDPWGIEPGYQDAFGTWRRTDPLVAQALRRAMGATGTDPAEHPPAGTPLRFVYPGDLDGRPADGGDHRPQTLVLEDGTRVPLAVGAPLPADLPFGYHRLEVGPSAPRSLRDPGPEVTNLIVTPGRCALPADLRVWGLTAQLYAARSSCSWGIGDLADLGRLVSWARERGASVVGLNPLHAPTPADHPADSPYSPSSRRWRNPLYIAVEQVPGAAQIAEVDRLATAGRALNGSDRIDRTAVWRLKRAALQLIWDSIGADPALDAYRREQGQPLRTWATFCALAEHHGSGWRSWPAEHSHPGRPEVEHFAASHERELGFWSWLQWLIDDQLQASGAPEVAIGDLAVGIDPDGADAWEWQDLLADGVTVGAPPDLLGPDGQDWALPPFVPWRLRDAGYAPFAETLRALARHGRGIRIDHVMGLFRLFWIPAGHTGADGAYVRFAGREMLDVLALESQRAGALVIGEDLGTVEAGVRERLAEAGVLSTRLLWFEDDPPARWPVSAMAAVTTHDLPTVAGVWTGVDLADQRAAGVRLPADGDATFRHRLRVAAACDDTATVDDVVLAVHRRLAEAPSMIATAALDDLTGATHRPNIPGTIDEHPNWRIALPVPLDELADHPLAEAVARSFAVARPSPRPAEGFAS